MKDEEQGDDSYRRCSQDGGEGEENQGLLRTGSHDGRSRERDDSVLHAAEADEADARSLRGGSLLPSQNTRQNGLRNMQLREDPTSPVYPPPVPALSPPTAAEKPVIQLTVSEKAIRPTNASPRAEDDEKSDNGWDWLDEDEVDDTISQQNSGRATPLPRTAVVA